MSVRDQWPEAHAHIHSVCPLAPLFTSAGAAMCFYHWTNLLYHISLWGWNSPVSWGFSKKGSAKPSVKCDFLGRNPRSFWVAVGLGVFVPVTVTPLGSFPSFICFWPRRLGECEERLWASLGCCSSSARWTGHTCLLHNISLRMLWGITSCQEHFLSREHSDPILNFLLGTQ